MKKIFLSVSLCLIAAIGVNAQVIEKGNVIVTAGFGFSSYHTGNGFSSSSLPLNAAIEYCIVDNMIDGNAAIGVGGYLGYAADKLNVFPNVVKRSHTVFGAKGYFHYQFFENLDTYGGLMLGYHSLNITTTPSNYTYHGNSSGTTASLFLGARYFFNDNLGAFIELGYGVTAIELGVALKF